ncbi:MAG: HIT family protein [Promethearchaeota archaeon]
MSDRLFHTYLTAPWKKEYVEQKKDPHQCILCAIAQKTAGVKSWEVFRDDQIMILLNRFPYNPGHLLVSPLDHYEQYEGISTELVSHLALVLQKCIKLLKLTHQTTMFNIGLNLGELAGGSVKHLHWHVVPRYPGDLNFMEMLETRVLVETLEQTMYKLKQNINVLQSK